MTSRRGAEDGDEGRLGQARDLPDRADAAVVQLAGRDRADAPQALHRGGWRKASSSPAGTWSRPSGLATALATLARNLELATPMVIGSPTSSLTWWRSRRAISTGSPETRRSPPTSRKASSIEIPSTIGVVLAKTSKTALLASV